MSEEIIARIKELSGAESVKELDTLRSVGIDSLAYVQLLVETEEKYGITFNDDELIVDETGTVGEFICIVEEKCKREH